MTKSHPLKDHARRLQRRLAERPGVAPVPYTTCLNHVTDTLSLLPAGLARAEKDERILAAALVVFPGAKP